jgi:hypothetical protein
LALPFWFVPKTSVIPVVWAELLFDGLIDSMLHTVVGLSIGHLSASGMTAHKRKGNCKLRVNCCKRVAGIEYLSAGGAGSG